MRMPIPMRSLVGMLLVATTGAFAQKAPHGWKVADAGNSCSYIVPSNWIEDRSHPGITTSGDGKSTVVPIPMPESFPQAKNAAAQKMPPLKVLQDSLHRYWYAYRDSADGEDSPDTHWLVVISGKSHVCAAQITFKTASGDAVARKIASGIRTR
jgi:hypothetical protein